MGVYLRGKSRYIDSRFKGVWIGLTPALAGNVSVGTDAGNEQIATKSGLRDTPQPLEVNLASQRGFEPLLSLIEPKTLSEVLRHLKAHNSIAISVIKHLMQHGFVTLLRTMNPTKKIYRLTKKGEVIREKLD